MAEHPQPSAEIYGVMAEFEAPHDLLHAARKAYAAGYRKMDAYSPLPVEGLSEALGFRHTRLPFVVLCGGLIGATVGYGMQYFISVIDYPMNIGGRPVHSWPMFLPITFEMTVLFAALSAVLGMLALNGMPMPYHPVFNVPEFGLASSDRFFLCIEAEDAQFDLDQTTKFLESLHPHKVAFVEP